MANFTPTSVQFDVALKYATKRIPFNHTLTEYQLEALRSLYEGRDTIVVLPTGSGKSIIFQMLPWLMEKRFSKASPMLVIVVCPLNSIMMDQVNSLNEKGIPACYLDMEGSIIFGKSNLEEQSSSRGHDFRKSFTRLGELTILFPEATQLALTATAVDSSINSLVDTLFFRNVKKILCNPDRPNIFLQIRRRLPNIHKFEKYDAIISPICDELKEKGISFPLTIVYCDNVESLGYCFQYLVYELGNLAYFPGGSNCPEDRVIAQYHKDYTEHMKGHIINELRKQQPRLRLILATVALGMGVNAPSIQRVIHMRPPTSLEKYMQEIGRAGRNGLEAESICYYNMNDISKSRQGFQSEVGAYVQNDSTCLRKHLLNYFGYHNTICNGPPTRCCSNFAKQ